MFFSNFHTKFKYCDFQHDHGLWWTSSRRRIRSNRMWLWRLQSQDALPSATRESQKTRICLPLWNLSLLTLHSANEPSEPLTLKDLCQSLFSLIKLLSLAFQLSTFNFFIITKYVFFFHALNQDSSIHYNVLILRSFQLLKLIILLFVAYNLKQINSSILPYDWTCLQT